MFTADIAIQELNAVREGIKRLDPSLYSTEEKQNVKSQLEKLIQMIFTQSQAIFSKSDESSGKELKEKTSLINTTVSEINELIKEKLAPATSESKEAE